MTHQINSLTRWPIVFVCLSMCVARLAAQMPVTVTTTTPSKQTIHRKLQIPASVLPYEETPLFAKIPGFIRKIHVDIGDTVKGPKFNSAGKEEQPGQLLAELWVPEYEEEHKQKQALVAQAKAEVDQATAALATADAHVETAKAMVHEMEAGRKRALANFQRWDTEYQRIDLLVKQKVIDVQIRDETRNQFQSASAARDEIEAKVLLAEASQKEAEAKMRKAKADIATAQSRVLVAQAEEARVAALLSYASIRAPYDGQITRRNVHTGHFLQPNNSTPLFVVMSADVVRVVFEVPESEAFLIHKGLSAKLRVQAIPNQEFPGTVTRVSGALDARARTLRTEIDFVNDKKILRPGMYAHVHLTPEMPNLLCLPLSAVIAAGDQGFCFVVQDGKAKRLPLKLGVRDEKHVEVLRKQVVENRWDPLAGDEVIIVGNLDGITDGRSVTPAK